ncbi:MAG: choloylglycine hydrolase [Clostridia bacterium]|nr:choloylglycine hydrolase [Clostridia bacterium]
MCTSIAMNTADFYFGRNLDLEYDFGQRVVITPRGYPFHFRCEAPMTEHPAIIGMATVADGYPLYAEAANEHGLCIAGLNFPQNAYYYPEPSESRRNLSPFELIPWLLCHCRTVAEAKDLLAKTRLVDIPFSDSLPLTPLHWHIADRGASIAVEPTANGLQIYDNPMDVLTNEPPFPFHRANLCRYLHLSPAPPCNYLRGIDGVEPFGAGMGAIGLPGDASSPSRFVRAAFLLHHSRPAEPADEDACVNQFFHLLSAVEMVRGSVILGDGSCEFTRYSSCINADRGIYYYTTYENRTIRAVELRGREVGAELLEFAL